jgi:hypothetical protein
MNERLARMASAAKDLGRRMDDGSIVREVLQEHEEDIMQEQHIQLLEGKGSDGDDRRDRAFVPPAALRDDGGQP